MDNLVTIIVPNYNHAEYLILRMESLLGQTFRNFEIIIIDDYSTDNSRELIEMYRSNEKISHIIYNEKNSGSPYKQWAKGIRLAKGDFIWIAESDDYSEVSFIEVLIQYFNKDTCMVCCQALSVSEYEFRIYPKEPFFNMHKFNSSEFIENSLVLQNDVFNSGMVLFKREIVDDFILDRIAEYRLLGDWLFWIYLSTKGNVVQIGKFLTYRRLHEFNTTNKVKKDTFKYTDEHFLFLSDLLYILETNSAIYKKLALTVLIRFFSSIGILKTISFKLYDKKYSKLLYYDTLVIFIKYLLYVFVKITKYIYYISRRVYSRLNNLLYGTSRKYK